MRRFYTVRSGLIVEGVEHWLTERDETPPAWRKEFASDAAVVEVARKASKSDRGMVGPATERTGLRAKGGPAQTFVLSRADPSIADDDDDALNESHWAYMDQFDGRFVARGPLLAGSRSRWLGSVHILGLPDDCTPNDFVSNEPYQQAGLYSSHEVWRFENLLGTDMWEYERNPARPCFMLVVEASQVLSETSLELLRTQVDGLVVYGSLHPLEEDRIEGLVLAYESSRERVEALALPELSEGSVELYDWEFGGRN